MDPHLEARVVELELRFTEQQELLSQLSDVLHAQQKTIGSLEALVSQLRQRVSAEPGLVESGQQDRPPHY